MAGSYNHVVTKKGKLNNPERVSSMLEGSSGDVYETIEEMYGMIWYLASQIAFETGEATETVVEDARQKHAKGLEMSPGVKQ